MCCSQFWRQFKVLAWKNYLLKCRNPCVILVEIIIPVAVILGLGGVKSGLAPNSVHSSIPTGFYDVYPSAGNQSFEDMYNFHDCGGENLVWRCAQSSCNNQDFNATIANCERSHIAVAPQSSDNVNQANAAADFIQWANSYYDLASTYGTFKYFSSEAEFLNTIKSSGYSVSDNVPIYSSAIIFQSGYPNWEYSLRLNQSTYANGNQNTNPATSLKPLDLTISYNSKVPSTTAYPYNRAFAVQGIYNLMDLAHSFSATQTCRNTPGKCGSGDNVIVKMQGIANFPNSTVHPNNFWSSIGFVFALILIIALLYPISNVISVLVQEKETKMREGMYMMSLRSDSLWLSWWFHFMCLFLPLAIILTIAGRLLFTYSNGVYIFCYFMVFFISATSYGILISVLFNKSRTASIVGALLFFGGYFIFIGYANSSPSRSTILAASLHPACAFTYGTLAFAEYEDAQIGIQTNTWNHSNEYPISFQDSLTMMFVDAIYMAILAWYLSNIWPSEYGTQLPWYFIFDPKYYMKLCGFHSKSFNFQLVGDSSDLGNDAPVEPVPESLQSQIHNKTCVEIKDLVKEFNTNTGIKRAVDRLNLTMFSGQITALLGHNGAGKSTAIAMLTGLIPPDSGDAIIQGNSINGDMSEIRKALGVCPQHDVLYPQLTVEEHLTLFASFKGTPYSQLKEEVEKMIKSVGLTEKRKAYAKSLSGGQKRKLSVGIAFIGGSKVVFLDEPTSGMDPYSRRFTWNVIRQHREGRVVVLTTHFMDEADLLGDRIAIMGDGRLRCCGSSLYLKRIYGVGYNITFEKKDPTHFKSKIVEDLVLSRVSEAKVITDVGAEITMQLPFSSSSLFQGLFDHIDNNCDAIGVQSYGVSVTTLEEVFIKVSRGTETTLKAEAGRLKSTNNQRGPSAIEVEMVPTITSGDKVVKQPYEVIEADEELGPEKNKVMPIFDFEKIPEDAYLRLFKRHVLSLLLKRALYFTRDGKSWILSYVLPVIFLLVGMLVMKFTSYVVPQPSLKLTHGIYNKGISNNYLPTPYNYNSTFCYSSHNASLPGECTYNHDKSIYKDIMESISSSNKYPVLADSQADSVKGISQYLYDHRNDYKASFYGAYSFANANNSNSNSSLSSIDYIVHANYTAVFAGPLFQAILGEGIVSSINPESSVKVSIHPLPLTNRENSILSNYNANLVATFLLLAISFVPSAWISFVVREVETKGKYQQLVSGVSVGSYWLSTWIWDNLSFQPTIWMFIILIAGFPNTETLSSSKSGALGITWGLLILFGTAYTGFTYTISLLFKTPSGAQVSIIFITLVLGLILSIVGTVLRILSANAYLNYIRYLLCLLPPFALGDALNNLTLIQAWSYAELSGSQLYSVHDWKISGLNLAFLGWETVFYLLIPIVYEYISLIPSVQSCISPIDIPPTNNELKDEDVLAEEKRVSDNLAEKSSTILVKDVKKVYPGGKFAVKGVSIGIPNGEVFGLLGINGAGKSTTLSMLSGEVQPSSGEAYLSGLNLLTDVHRCRRKIGFCPQFDALFELLSAREHLQLYARIKGISEKDIDRVVNGKIAELGLTEYADRAAGGYSGGNKRKLSVAIAMIGEPSIIFLDEPSTGMDPVARRFMWEVITDIVTKRETCSMILTTHSMEECEALCTRIGIMVGGVLRCLGSAQRLRSRYGKGFQIEIGFAIPDSDTVNNNTNALLQSIGKNSSDHEQLLTKSDIQAIFRNNGRANWLSLLDSPDNEIGSIFQSDNSIVQTSAVISAIHLSNWWIFENYFTLLDNYLKTTFDTYILRERQVSRTRVEIDNSDSSGKLRKLADMFGSIEKNKDKLNIQEYSISQTSLEQIFNYFASQQEEETGAAAGIVK